MMHRIIKGAPGSLKEPAISNQHVQYIQVPIETTAETCLTVAQMCSWSEPSGQRASSGHLQAYPPPLTYQINQQVGISLTLAQQMLVCWLEEVNK